MAKRPVLLNHTRAGASLATIYLYLFICMSSFFMLAAGEQVLAQANLETAKHWKLFTYNFLPNAPVNDLDFYNPTNILATGIAVDRDRIFIATPKLFSGVSSTVSFVNKADYSDAPVLQAYPDWSFSTTGRTDFNCSDLVLISVYRLRIDSCNRLWVLDAGVSRSIEDYEITCPPKILIIDLNTNRVVRRVDFPRQILRGESLLTNLIVDETTSKSGTCDDVFAYISDTVEPAIIVYDSGRDVTWRLTHPAMYPDPDFAQGEILNDRFILMDGVVGLTFDAKNGIVYFQPFATDRIFSVTREALRAGPLAQNQILQVKLVGKKSSQGIGMAISPIDGSLIFSPMTETAIATWNPQTNRQSVLAYDRDRLQFVADITTTTSEDGVIYAISSKFQRFFLKNLNPSEINNRILRIQLPKTASAPHTGLSAIGFNLGNYARKPLLNLNNYDLQQSNYYQTNALDKNAVAQILPKPTQTSIPKGISYFRSPSKHPYNYEQSGIINYSLRNPFMALNQGEVFPPRKELRNQPSYRISFIDGLAAGNSADGRSSGGYFYERGVLGGTKSTTEVNSITSIVFTIIFPLSIFCFICCFHITRVRK